MEATRTSPQYQSLARRAWLAQRWIALTGILAFALVCLEVVYLTALGAPAGAVELGRLVDLSDLIQLCVQLLGAGIFLAWFFRAYANVPALGAPFVRHGRRWAAVAWFVPVAALFWPKQMANDAWRASEPDAPANDPDWLKRPVAPLLHGWWAAWLVANFAANAAGRLEADTLGQARIATIVGITADSLYVLAAVLCILVIRRLTARQEARAGATAPVLRLTEEQRAAAEQQALRRARGLRRRIAWYAAGTLLVLLAAAAAYASDGVTSSFDVEAGVGYLLAAPAIGIVAVQLIGLVARRRPALMSGWAALAALVVMVSAAGAQAVSAVRAPNSGLAHSATTKAQPTLLVTPETYSATAGTVCWSVTVVGPTERVVRRLIGPVFGSW